MTCKTYMFTRLAAVLTLLTVLCGFHGTAQVADSMIVDVARLNFYEQINDQCWFVAAPKGSVPTEKIPQLDYRSDNIRKYKDGFPESLLEKDNFLKFVLSNSSDSVMEVYISPAIYFRRIALYKASDFTPQAT